MVALSRFPAKNECFVLSAPFFAEPPPLQHPLSDPDETSGRHPPLELGLKKRVDPRQGAPDLPAVKGGEKPDQRAEQDTATAAVG